MTRTLVRYRAWILQIICSNDTNTKYCLKASLFNVFFVGFRPFPSRIEASEFEQLQAQAEKDNDPDVNLLSEWLACNCV